MKRTKFDLSLLPDHPDLTLESALWLKGLVNIAGIDEAGRGAWAGPVAAGAVILPPDALVEGRLSGVRDSKQMTPAQRADWAVHIRGHALAWAVGMASHEEIDRIGIVPATRLAVCRALAALAVPPDQLLVDYLPLPEVCLPQISLVKGDARSLSIACASVLAKTARDAWMTARDADFPGYDFAAHKGYGTQAHQAAIRQFGPCAIHRMSFAPLALHLPLQEAASS